MGCVESWVESLKLAEFRSAHRTVGYRDEDRFYMHAQRWVVGVGGGVQLKLVRGCAAGEKERAKLKNKG